MPPPRPRGCARKLGQFFKAAGLSVPAEIQPMIDQLVPTDPLGMSLTQRLNRRNERYRSHRGLFIQITLIEALVAHAELAAVNTTVAHGAAMLIATEHLLVRKTDWLPAIGTYQIRFCPAAIDIALRHFCSSESGKLNCNQL